MRPLLLVKYGYPIPHNATVFGFDMRRRFGGENVIRRFPNNLVVIMKDGKIYKNSSASR